ncbi:hypothetical protein P3544_23240 [Vibrio parahaemolyticus]|nr:hypothetical protein [Vibrio parahaemolyticus]MDF4716072.1 hypothetical protein [Vibrio parahaemolyticus]
MTKVFISGSRSIKNINPLVTERIDKMIDREQIICIGDADGVDSSIQEYISTKLYSNLIVYCVNNVARNNVGNWSTKSVETSLKEGTRSYFTVKDVVMAQDCDLGFMVWDAKSEGTLKNSIELLKLKKNSVVFINKVKKFHVVKDVNDFEVLLGYMSDSALKKVDAKLKIRSVIEMLKNEQSSLF